MGLLEEGVLRRLGVGVLEVLLEAFGGWFLDTLQWCNGVVQSWVRIRQPNHLAREGGGS